MENIKIKSIEILRLKYRDIFNFYFSKPINEILANLSLSHVIFFKDLLYCDEENEYLKRYYKLQETFPRIKLLTEFYVYSFKETRPNLCIINSASIIIKRNNKIAKKFYENDESKEKENNLIIPRFDKKIEKILPSTLNCSTKNSEYFVNYCNNQKNMLENAINNSSQSSSLAYNIYKPKISGFNYNKEDILNFECKNSINDLSGVALFKEFVDIFNGVNINKKREIFLNKKKIILNNGKNYKESNKITMEKPKKKSETFLLSSQNSTRKYIEIKESFKNVSKNQENLVREIFKKCQEDSLKLKKYENKFKNKKRVSHFNFKKMLVKNNTNNKSKTSFSCKYTVNSSCKKKK